MSSGNKEITNKFSVNDVAKKFNILKADGTVQKNRYDAYNRMLNILSILYDETDPNLKVIQNAETFYHQFGFSPSRLNTSLADKLLVIGILGPDYVINEPDLFKAHKDFWEDRNEGLCLYEKTDPEIIAAHFEDITQDEFAVFDQWDWYYKKYTIKADFLIGFFLIIKISPTPLSVKEGNIECITFPYLTRMYKHRWNIYYTSSIFDRKREIVEDFIKNNTQSIPN